MTKPAIPNIDLSASVFDAANPILSSEKLNYDEEGNVIGALPDSAAIRGVTAELQNLVDNLVRSSQRRLSGSWRSVIEHGAEGDGSTDDTAAIQAAIDVGAGTVFFPPGTYLVTQIERPGGVMLKGAGAPHTIIRAAAPSAAIIDSPVSAYAVSPTQRRGGVSDMLIDGTDRANAGSVGVSFAGCYDAEVSNVDFQNLETGLLLEHSAYWNTIEKCRFAVVGIGISVTNNSNENRFASCHVLDCETGYAITEGPDRGVSNLIFDTCAVEQSTDSAYYVEALNAQGVDNLEIRCPRIERAVNLPGVQGVELVGTHRNVAVEQPFFVNVDTPFSGLLDNSRVTWRGQQKNGVRIGVPDDLTVSTHSLLYYSAGGGYPVLRNSADSAYESIRVDWLILGSGVRIGSASGAPEGTVTGGLGWEYIDASTGTKYRKSTASGNTGWVAVGANIYREEFGYDADTGTGAEYVPFTSSVVETSTVGDPRAYNIWRAPATGTITNVYLIFEANAGDVSVQWYESDGSTARSSAVVETASSFTLGSGTAYQITADFAEVVSVGDLLTLVVNPTSGIGEVNGWLELSIG